MCRIGHFDLDSNVFLCFPLLYFVAAFILLHFVSVPVRLPLSVCIFLLHASECYVRVAVLSFPLVLHTLYCGLSNKKNRPSHSVNTLLKRRKIYSMCKFISCLVLHSDTPFIHISFHSKIVCNAVGFILNIQNNNE